MVSLWATFSKALRYHEDTSSCFTSSPIPVPHPIKEVIPYLESQGCLHQVWMQHLSITLGQVLTEHMLKSLLLALFHLKMFVFQKGINIHYRCRVKDFPD